MAEPKMCIIFMLSCFLRHTVGISNTSILVHEVQRRAEILQWKIKILQGKTNTERDGSSVEIAKIHSVNTLNNLLAIIHRIRNFVL